MTEFWDDILPRLLGILAAFVVTWAAQHWHLTLDVKEVTALFLAIYAIVHRAVTAGRNSVRLARAHRSSFLVDPDAIRRLELSGRDD